jgi:hypothetical protein
MSTLRLKSKIYNLFLGILIVVLVFLGELYLSKTISGIKLPPLVSFAIGAPLGILLSAIIVHEAYRRVFSSVKVMSLRHMVINIITLLAILLAIEFSLNIHKP